MKVQTIETTGEDLVILSRRDYDALLARAGIEDAEDRMTARIVDAHLAAGAPGPAPGVPAWLATRLAAGEPPLRAARLGRGRTQADLAAATGLPQGYISAIESGRKPASASALTRLAQALDVDRAWLVDE